MALRRRRPLLLTGFEPFEGFPVNSSWEGIRHLDGQAIEGVSIVARKLPSTFRELRPFLNRVLNEVKPAAIVAFGLTPSRTVSVERVALNMANVNPSTPRFPTPGDNDGYRPRHRLLRKDGPDIYWSTLPVHALERTIKLALEKMKNKIVPWMSYSAGTFLCNAAFYHIAEWASRSRPCVPAGFIHVAPLRGAGDPSQGKAQRFTLKQLRGVVTNVVRTVVRSL